MKFLKNLLFHLKKNNRSFNPVFIIGCGRSGTTILGKTLSQHPEIKYLNERRDLWHKAYPKFDIWKKEINDSILFADKSNITPKKNSILRTLFFKEQVLDNAKILLEKLPANNFRLDFLKNSFPEAKYIYLTRNGLEVSASIEKKILEKKWFVGKKLDLLIEFAKTKNLPFNPKTITDIEKGMLEWRLSMDESTLFFKSLSKKRFVHVSYQDFVENPKNSLCQIFDFLNINSNNKLLSELSKNITRKNASLNYSDNDALNKIGGEILIQTIANNYCPFLVSSQKK